jgi:TRAP-type C4-dicarboxylate transport system permease small subunit
MKDTAMFWVVATTLVLLTVTMMATLGFAFSWVFYVTVLGQGLVVFMVYKVLTDNYRTDKTFDDFYEDYPIKKRIN